MLSRLFFTLAVLFAGSTLVNAAEAEKGRTVDVAICLDTSNSMDGLIDSAKSKLWTIINDLAKIKPAPVLRVALYQYGNDDLDAKTGWVRKELDLTTDLDEVYKKLNALRTHGGTELVARVCRDAIRELKWTDDKDSLKMIFVCGNEPANQDKEVNLQSVADMAKKQGVFVNTIYCGPSAHPEVAAWKEFAINAGGKYANIDQNRAQTVVAIKTPHDEELLKLNNKLNGTYVYYGREGKEKCENQAVQDSNALKTAPRGAAPAAALDRAATKATGLYCNSGWDIIDRMKQDPKFKLSEVKEEELSDELKKIKPAEREAYIKKKAEERAQIQKDIQELSGKRSAYIQQEMKKQPKSKADASFDEAVTSMIRDQANSKGIKISD
jgi:hypothetical protein